MGHSVVMIVPNLPREMTKVAVQEISHKDVLTREELMAQGKEKITIRVGQSRNQDMMTITHVKVVMLLTKTQENAKRNRKIIVRMDID